MTQKIIFCILFFLLPFLGLATRGYFELSPLTKQAQQKTLELKIEEASILLAKAKTEEPNNMMAYFVENYLDFMRVFINENKKEFNLLKKK